MNQYNQSGMRFRNAIPKISLVNTILIILNVIVFIFLEIIGNTNDSGFMYLFGASYTSAVMREHQVWRLFTSMFMHFGIKHLVNNMIVLAFIGDNLERALGKIKYIILYIGSGFISGGISAYMNYITGQNVVAAGASGAIFGVVGGLLVVLIINRGAFEDLSLERMVMFVVLSIYLGLQNTHTDNVAHIAGLIVGTLMSLILYRKNKI